MKRRNRSHISLPEVNVIPLIDVSLMLLLVFMLTAPMLQHGISVNLPEGQSKEVKEKKQELVVYIDKKEALFLNNKLVSPDTLISTIKEQVSANDEKTVFVKADSSISYGKVIELVDHIKFIGGVKYVALATKPAATKH